eukprot:TRINITY_DN5472_c0_g1_i3.p1 TRINITY_DN5472_c0_g1~~TRINITY_DN5472_c0_g1_i3.p1  ORF type:complete len:188 (-),score=30.32 TRINITY_DN5472_c0_g1_i3:53-616(-)
MFGLMFGCWKFLFDPREYPVAILGTENTGKTTWMEKAKSLYNKEPGLSPDKIISTVGLNIGKIRVGYSVLKFWDLGGERGLRSIWNNYIKDAKAIVYVIDASNQEQLEDAKETFKNLMNRPELSCIPVLVIANKYDVNGAEDVNFLINHMELKEAKGDIHIVACSAITGAGIKEGIDWLLHTLPNTK